MDDNQTPYEVRCHRCETTFPVGTRQCIHCGGRIAKAAGRPFPMRPSPQGAVPRTPEMLGLPGAATRDGSEREFDPDEFFETGHEEEEPAAARGGPLRISLWSLSVGLALIGSMFRACQGG